MQIANRYGKLIGILNGCEYPQEQSISKPDVTEFLNASERTLFVWMARTQQLTSSHYIAHQRVKSWLTTPSSGPLITSVGRLTDQKALLLRQATDTGIVLDELAKITARSSGRLIVLGSGDAHLEYVFTKAMARNDNLLFLNGYGQSLGDMLYDIGDLFLMPSSFEPCGISQMLAMRSGQPCLVHQVGGLSDTVAHLESGFVFSGEDLHQQKAQLLNMFTQALELYDNDINRYDQIRDGAQAKRFEWDNVALSYINSLYTH